MSDGNKKQALECDSLTQLGENDSTPFAFSFQLIQNIIEFSNKQYINDIEIPVP